MQNQINPEADIRDPNQKLPDHAARSMSAKGKYDVDCSCQHDEPGNGHVNRYGGKKWRTHRRHAQHNQQNSPPDGERRSLTYNVDCGILCHGNLLEKAETSYLKHRLSAFSRVPHFSRLLREVGLLIVQ